MSPWTTIPLLHICGRSCRSLRGQSTAMLRRLRVSNDDDDDAKARGPKGRQRGWGSWGRAPSPPARGRLGSAVSSPGGVWDSPGRSNLGLLVSPFFAHNIYYSTFSVCSLSVYFSQTSEYSTLPALLPLTVCVVPEQ